MTRNQIILFLIGAIVFTIASCVPPEDTAADNDILLAKVYNKPLYLSELDGMIPRTASPTDSTLIVNAFVDRWVKENLMLYEAERNVPKDLNIDKLVRDYRASLILHNYEKNIAESALDSVITDEEIMKYYTDYKTHFQLETSIKRCKFMKFPKETANLKKAEKWWNSDDEKDTKALEQFCKDYAITFQLEDSIWVTNHELEKEFPKSVISSMREGKDFDMTEGDFKYYVNVMEVQSKNSDPPLGYVRKHATNFILHNRKLQLVEKKREELFQNAEQKGHVKYFN